MTQHALSSYIIDVSIRVVDGDGFAGLSSCQRLNGWKRMAGILKPDDIGAQTPEEESLYAAQNVLCSIRCGRTLDLCARWGAWLIRAGRHSQKGLRENGRAT